MSSPVDSSTAIKLVEVAMRQLLLLLCMAIVFPLAYQPTVNFEHNPVSSLLIGLGGMALVAGAAHAGRRGGAGLDISVYASVGGGMIAPNLLNTREWHYNPQPAPAAEKEMIFTVVTVVVLMVVFCNLAAHSAANTTRNLIRQSH